MTVLSDYATKNAKPAAKEYYLKDGAGLFLRVKPSGVKIWVFRFYWQGKQVKLTIGQYPAISLKQAREKRDSAREALALNKDPRVTTEAAGQAPGYTFVEFVPQWLDYKLRKLNAVPSKEKKNGGRQGTAIQIERAMRNDILPILRNKPLAGITRTDVLAIQTRIEARGALSIAEKVRTWLNEIFRYAMATGAIDHNPAADMDMAAIPYRRIHHNPHLSMAELPELLAKINRYNGAQQTILGLKLLLLTGVRTGELRFAEPQQFDLDNALWRIPPEDVKQLQRVKREKDAKVPDYLVPLPRQAVDIIKELLACRFPAQRYLLSSISNPKEAISENTLNGALKRMGYKDRLTAHGIRGTLSTALNELGYNKDWIEAQLSHSDKDKIRGAYNHANYVEQRRQMMQAWADRLHEWEQEGLLVSV